MQISLIILSTLLFLSFGYWLNSMRKTWLMLRYRRQFRRTVEYINSPDPIKNKMLLLETKRVNERLIEQGVEDFESK